MNTPRYLCFFRTFRWLCVSALLVMLSACSFAPRQIPATLTHEQANDVTLRAISLVGTPYRYGGNSPETGFDCSGFVGHVYSHALDISLPRSSGEISTMGKAVRSNDLRTGDLVIFGNDPAWHAGIYVGEGRFVHAPSTGGTVRLDRLDNRYWARQPVRYRRP